MSQYVIGGSVIVLGIIILCLLKPNGGRLFLGFFYLAMGLGVNLVLGLTTPLGYLEMGEGALLPLYRELFSQIISLNPMVFILLIAAFQITMGLLILYKRRAVKIGLVGTMVFVVAITPLGIHQIPWLGLPLIQAYLLTKDFNKSFVEIIYSKIRRE